MKNLTNVGLTDLEAKKRLARYGKNEIKRTKKISRIKIFLSQFTSPLILLLIIAALISFAIGYLPGQESRIIDTTLILLIVFVSGISGFFQEYKAERSIEALQKMATPKAHVLRNGKEIEIDATKIVPGDVVLLDAGDVIPADAKLLESFNLKVDESSLTGESKQVKKRISDMVFMNSFVYSGRGNALVIKTGMKTEIGKIAAKLQEIKEEKTSFEKEISNLSKKIFLMISGIIAVIFLLSILKYNLYESLLTAVSLAVAAIPEGLPAIVVLALAVGAKTMASKNALIRKLSVVESIGAVDIICTDKTGTITKNEMSVTDLYANNKVIDIDIVDKEDVDQLKELFICGSLCNNSKIIYNKEGKKYLGDQTEIAVLKASEKFGFSKEELEKNYEKINELSFSSERKMMTVFFKYKNQKIAYSKGAPEVLIEKCNRIYDCGKIRKLRTAEKKEILKQNKKFASKGLRVLGFAFKKILKSEPDKENNLIWIGLEAMTDPPRAGVKDVLEKCKTAGIRVIMITGDNPITAKAIADEIGLKSAGVLTGKELDHLNHKQLKKKLETGVNIFARTTPLHKLRILKILQEKNRVAMTGDGVNDALALKKANVGVAMNIRGTDVAKESSDMILLDDNFVTIVAAIKEGRKIFDNIRKFINYLLVCNFAEVAVLFIATLFLTLKEPILLPVQILWINLLTDGMPALALGLDPARKNIMSDPPRKKNEPIINKNLGWLIVTIGIKITFILLGTFFLVRSISGLEEARTALFTGFILYEFVRIGSIRYQDKLGWLSNKWLLGSLIVSLLLQLLIIYSPLNSLFYVVPLGLYSWMVLISGTIVGYVLAVEITKVVTRFVKG